MEWQRRTRLHVPIGDAVRCPRPVVMDERENLRLCIVHGWRKRHPPRSLGSRGLLLLPRLAGTRKQRHRSAVIAWNQVPPPDHYLARRSTRQRNNPYNQQPGHSSKLPCQQQNAPDVKRVPVEQWRRRPWPCLTPGAWRVVSASGQSTIQAQMFNKAGGARDKHPQSDFLDVRNRRRFSCDWLLLLRILIGLCWRQ